MHACTHTYRLDRKCVTSSHFYSLRVRAPSLVAVAACTTHADHIQRPRLSTPCSIFQCLPFATRQVHFWFAARQSLVRWGASILLFTAMLAWWCIHSKLQFPSAGSFQCPPIATQLRQRSCPAPISRFALLFYNRQLLEQSTKFRLQSSLTHCGSSPETWTERVGRDWLATQLRTAITNFSLLLCLILRLLLWPWDWVRPWFWTGHSSWR